MFSQMDASSTIIEVPVPFGALPYAQQTSTSTPTPLSTFVEAPRDIEQEERSLRRKLLFRMLKTYDFDAPDTWCEQIADPVPEGTATMMQDHFEFLAAASIN